MKTIKNMMYIHYLFVFVFISYIYMIIDEIVYANKVSVTLFFTAYFISPIIYFFGFSRDNNENISQYLRFCTVSGLMHASALLIYCFFSSNSMFIISVESIVQAFLTPFCIFFIPYLIVRLQQCLVRN